MYQVGDLVLSRQGRDHGKIFMVLGVISESYVLIADGKLRPVEKPKKKKMKHLEYIGKAEESIILRLSEKELTNPQLKKMLKSKSEG